MIKLLVLDCDGVLSGGEARPFNLALLSRLADLNRRARRGEPVPAVTLNTGRPSPYVEAVLQAIDGRLPALFETGGGLYFPDTYRFETSPLLTPAHQTALAEIVRRVDKTLVQRGRAYWQPGKQVCHSLFAHPPLRIDAFVAEVEVIAAEVSADIAVTPAKLALNIHPARINKGNGLQWLANETGIDPADMAGVGDTSGDIDFLRLVKQAAAPGNATDDVRQMVGYVSPRPDAEGVLDILDHWAL